MARTKVYQAEIEYLQILDEEGRVDPELIEGLPPDEAVVSLYETMFICREFDEVAFKLQRSGRMGTYPQNKGHEAIALGAAYAMRKGIDYIVGYYRENAALFWHGLPMHQVLLHWMGDERGNAIPTDLSMNPLCLAIGTQTLHAVGIAWAFKLRREDRAVVCFFGEGATSTGDFHEAMNFASLLKVPCVFCCENNQWAISVPRSRQTASQTIAQKAIAYGMPSIQVDGNDLFAVYKAHHDALERARRGEGPSLTGPPRYRPGPHPPPDAARRYRDAGEHEKAVSRDPLIRTRKYLESKSLWDDARQAKLLERSGVVVHEVTEAALGVAKPETEDMFRHTFDTLPEELERQMRTLRTDSIGQDPDQIGLQSVPRRRANASFSTATRRD